jgi:hypothetical protein
MDFVKLPMSERMDVCNPRQLQSLSPLWAKPINLNRKQNMEIIKFNNQL